MSNPASWQSMKLIVPPVSSHRAGGIEEGGTLSFSAVAPAIANNGWKSHHP